MNQDPRMIARTAREGLAQALAVLQADPTFPPELFQIAEPIAQAMGALLHTERSDGSQATIFPHAETALIAVRSALSRLQAMTIQHPALEPTMAAVAGSLGNIHALHRWSSAVMAAPAPVVHAPAQIQQVQPKMAPIPVFQVPAAPAFVPAPPPPQQPVVAQPNIPVSQHKLTPLQNFAVPQPSTETVSTSSSQGLILEAELGAHSASNFYKTLNGNDIVEHGGIFVSTYKIPRIGSRVHLRIHLPGDYQFECYALVRWIREAIDTSDSPSGFGAQLQGITVEQRQLIQRYVRNREPLFYDDF